jgi:LytS/YehU family sensor histidine kinase
VVGLLLGAAAGGVIACTANRDAYGVFCGGQDDTKLVIGAAIGGAAGATLGALLFRRERWTAVDVPRH